jgi:transcriptional regulator with XRE-family HTH domain
MRKKNLIDTIRENIVRLRKANGWSQTDLAKKMKTSQRLVAYYEDKSANMPLEKLQEFAEVFDVSVGALLDERPVNGNVGPEVDLRLLKRVKQIDSLPRRAKDALIHNINTAIENHEMKAEKRQNKKVAASLE